MIPIHEKLPAAESISATILMAANLIPSADAAKIAYVSLASPLTVLPLFTRSLCSGIAPEADVESDARPEGASDTIQKKIEPWADIVVDDQLSRHAQSSDLKSMSV